MARNRKKIPIQKPLIAKEAAYEASLAGYKETTSPTLKLEKVKAEILAIKSKRPSIVPISTSDF